MGILPVSGRVSLFRGEDTMTDEVVRRGGFLYTPLHATACPSPASVTKNKGTCYLGGATSGFCSDTSGTTTKALFLLRVLGDGNTQ